MLQEPGPSPQSLRFSATRQSSLSILRENHTGKPDQAAEAVSRKNFRCRGAGRGW